MKKQEIVDAIATCTEMCGMYHNGRTPDASFSPSIKKIRTLLTEMLELKREYKKKSKSIRGN